MGGAARRLSSTGCRGAGESQRLGAGRVSGVITHCDRLVEDGGVEADSLVEDVHAPLVRDVAGEGAVVGAAELLGGLEAEDVLPAGRKARGVSTRLPQFGPDGGAALAKRPAQGVGLVGARQLDSPGGGLSTKSVSRVAQDWPTVALIAEDTEDAAMRLVWAQGERGLEGCWSEPQRMQRRRPAPGGEGKALALMGGRPAFHVHASNEGGAHPHGVLDRVVALVQLGRLEIVVAVVAIVAALLQSGEGCVWSATSAPQSGSGGACVKAARVRGMWRAGAANRQTRRRCKQAAPVGYWSLTST